MNSLSYRRSLTARAQASLKLGATTVCGALLWTALCGCQNSSTSAGETTSAAPSPPSAAPAAGSAATLSPSAAATPPHVPAAASAASPAPLHDPTTYDIDPSDTHIGFTVRHLMVTNVRGEFRKFKGTAFIDEKNSSMSKLTLDIDAASIDTGDAKRDEHLRSADFFDAARFPKITFVSTSAERTGGGWVVIGTLTLHGVSKPLTLSIVPLTPDAKDPAGVIHRGTHARAKLNRQDYGLTWNKTLETGGAVVGDEVLIDLDVGLVQRKG